MRGLEQQLVQDSNQLGVYLLHEEIKAGRIAARANSEEKREPASDINTPVGDSLKVLDPNGR